MFERKYFGSLCLVILILITMGIGSVRAEGGFEGGEAGYIELTNTKGKVFSALHVETQVAMQINGMVAEVNYVQRFRNDSTDWVEGQYLFPLPESAAVNDMEIRLNERVIKGEIKERAEARQVYQQAKDNGQLASLVEQQRPNMFTQNVANIAPNESIEVSITYLHRVGYEQGQFSIRLPLTITPRYIPGTPLRNNEEITLGHQGWGWAEPTNKVTDADHITPYMLNLSSSDSVTNNPVSIEIELDAGLNLANVDSAYHQVNVSRDQQQYKISLKNGKEAMDRDFVLNWRPVTSQAPTAALFAEEFDGEDYLMMMLLPPEQKQASDVLARDVMFVVDTSGSMEGSSIIQAKESLQLALKTLNSSDRFNIIEFNLNFTKLSPNSLDVNTQTLARAQSFVSRLQANGGTEMYPALEEALLQKSEEGYLKQIVFITDGSIGNEDELFSLIHQELNNSRLFTVGIGSAPNSHFMSKAAEFGRGTFTYVGSINDVSEKMSSLFRQLDSPVLKDIVVSWPDGVDVEMWPEQIPDLYAGQPLILSAKLSELTGMVNISGQSSASQWEQSLILLNQNEQHAGIANLWARDKISALLSDKVEGGDEELIKQQVLGVALSHQLMSPYTSFVAVEEKPKRPFSDHLTSSAIPNLLAQGQTMMGHTYPKGGLGIQLNVLLACLALLLALLVFAWRPSDANKLC